MNITNAESLALIAMSEHGLISEGWTFSFDRAKQRFGYCNHTAKRISISKTLTELNEELEIKDTILHEIAHALTGLGNGHNYRWRMKCVQVGARPERCYSSATVIQPTHKWLGTCPNGHNTKRMKRMKLSCSRCQPTWNPKYLFIWTLNEELVLNS